MTAGKSDGFKFAYITKKKLDEPKFLGDEFDRGHPFV
jgi:hypothetical protein